MAAGTYRALTGIDFPPDRRVEAGDLVDDLPADSLRWLLDGGYIEAADAPAPTGKKSKATEVVDPAVTDPGTEGAL